MELNNEYNEFHEEFNSQMAFPSRTTHGDVNGLQPLDTPVDKAWGQPFEEDAMLWFSGDFFLGFTVHRWPCSDHWPSLCQLQKEKKFGQRHDAAIEKATQTQSFRSHLSGATFQQEICSTYLTHVYQFVSSIFTHFYRYIQLQWFDHIWWRRRTRPSRSGAWKPFPPPRGSTATPVPCYGCDSQQYMGQLSHQHGEFT